MDTSRKPINSPILTMSRYVSIRNALRTESKEHVSVHLNCPYQVVNLVAISREYQDYIDKHKEMSRQAYAQRKRGKQMTFGTGQVRFVPPTKPIDGTVHKEDVPFHGKGVVNIKANVKESKMSGNSIVAANRKLNLSDGVDKYQYVDPKTLTSMGKKPKELKADTIARLATAMRDGATNGEIVKLIKDLEGRNVTIPQLFCIVAYNEMHLELLKTAYQDGKEKREANNEKVRQRVLQQAREGLARKKAMAKPQPKVEDNKKVYTKHIVAPGEFYHEKTVEVITETKKEPEVCEVPETPKEEHRSNSLWVVRALWLFLGAQATAILYKVLVPEGPGYLVYSPLILGAVLVILGLTLIGLEAIIAERKKNA